VLYYNMYMKQRFMTSTTCKNAYTNLFSLWPEHRRCWHEHLRSSCVHCMLMLMVDTLSTCSDMNIHLYDSPEHFMKLLMSFDAWNRYFVDNIKGWSCSHPFPVVRLSHGSAAALIRWGGWSSYQHMYHLSLTLTVQTTVKSVDFWWSCTQK